MTAVAPRGFAVRYPLFMRTLPAAVWLLGAAMAVQAVKIAGGPVGGSDAHAYWMAGQGPLTYSRPPQGLDAFLYSPLFADLTHPLTVLPWPVFWTVWAVLEGLVLGWLVWPLGLRWAVPVWLACTPELAVGNIYLLLAAAAVLGMRRPAVWLFPVLTKVTTGVGLVWFVARGEWRRLLEVGTVLVVLVGVSYLLQPGDWLAWLTMLVSHPGGARDGVAGLTVRCVAAVVLVVVGARTGRVWLVPVAMILANPVWTATTLVLLAAVPRLTRSSEPRRSRSTVSPA